MLAQRLAAFARQEGIRLSKGEVERLASLDEMLVRWGRAVRVSGLETLEDRFERYYAEALAASRWLRERGLAVDVGSGGGSPALPMAMCSPELGWALLEPNRRRALFVEEAAKQLGLRNVSVERARLEGYRPSGAVQVVSCRGLSLDGRRLRTLAGWLAGEGRLLLFTGKGRSQEFVRTRLGLPGDWIGRHALAPTRRSWLAVWERA
ncbi:MAG: 16S rRNA (guanine(527)-N(7))-methyltransferase RsmG [Acidobacteriota bacterium]